MVRLPDYSGGSLANLMCELERRLTGHAPLPGLHDPLAATIPESETYVLVLFDGLGDHQLAHPRATTLAGSRTGVIDAPFPTTTIVSLSTIATGLAPAGHGILSHFLDLEGHGVVNALKWTHPGGRQASVDTSRLLPGPNLWERLRAAGIEPITVQPGNFENSPTSRLLYRGCRFEGAWSGRDLVEITCELAATPGRLILTYFPQLDLAAHVAGQESALYTEAMEVLDSGWSTLVHRLPPTAVAVGTADHGHIDYGTADKHDLGRGIGTLFGDPRGILGRGEVEKFREWASTLPARLEESPRHLFGPGDHPALAHRLPDVALLPGPGTLLIPTYMDNRLVGYHGGLDDREREVPLLVTAG